MYKDYSREFLFRLWNNGIYNKTSVILNLGI